MAVVSDIMTKDVTTVPPEMPVREVAELLASKHYGSVPVVDDSGKVLGIVTEEDMVWRAADLHLPHYITFLGSVIYLEDPRRFQEEAEKILALTARDIMEERFTSIRPDVPVDDAAALMLRDNIRRLLVIDEDDRLIGVVARADIVSLIAREGGVSAEEE